MTYHKSDDPDSSEFGARRRSHRHRGRRHSVHSDRKERVLHTRISEQLSEDIRRFVLEEVFTVVDGVSDDVSELFDDLLEEAEGVRERVRRQTTARSRSRGAPRRHSTDVDVDPQEAADADVEAELRRDEATQALSGSGTPKSSAPGPSGRSAGSSHAEPESDRPAANELFPDVLGWQPLVLNRDFACGRCKRSLKAGESAFLGLAASGLTEIALCGRCAGRR
jgi:hypothetical protein